MRLLIVEDEEALAEGLKFNFEEEGYEVVHAGDGPMALELFENAETPFALVILDLMLPSMSGYEICRRIREIDGQVPILALSARTLSEDRTRAFDCGTDQYMTKPFVLPELISRVRNLVERHPRSHADTHQENIELPDSYSFDGIEVDFRTFQITASGAVHDLTKLELELLRYFIAHEGEVLSRIEILENVWGLDSNASTRTIDNFVMRLRKIIEDNAAEPQHLLSVRGTGYRFLNKMDAATAD
jgi:two-component system OmpR family response regulator